MLDHYDFPNAVDIEKQLLSAMFMDEDYIVPKVLSIINADDLYRPEHQFIFNAIVSLYSSGKPVDFLSVEHELQRNGDHNKIDHIYLLGLINATFTTARAEYHAAIIKEKADLRRLIVASKIIRKDANQAQLSPADIIAKAQLTFDQISRSVVPSKKFSFADFFANHFDSEIEQMKNWIIVNKVDKKLERGEKFSFKIIRRKKIDGRMRTLGIVKTVNILKQGKL